eukprot:14011-Eustigmatos_ZCMA.PRE.1
MDEATGMRRIRLSENTSIAALRHWFPEHDPGLNSSVVYRNAPSAPFADLVTQLPCHAPDHRLLMLHECKHT